jgi:hypothetical protein
MPIRLVENSTTMQFLFGEVPLPSAVELEEAMLTQSGKNAAAPSRSNCFAQIH